MAGNGIVEVTDANFDQATHLERDDGFANRCTRHAKRHGQFAFGRQARSSRKFAVRDQLRNLIGDLTIKALRLDGLQRHSGFPQRRSASARLQLFFAPPYGRLKAS